MEEKTTNSVESNMDKLFKAYRLRLLEHKNLERYLHAKMVKEGRAKPEGLSTYEDTYGLPDFRDVHAKISAEILKKKKEISLLERRVEYIYYVPIIFDYENFSEVETHLQELVYAGINDIKLSIDENDEGCDVTIAIPGILKLINLIRKVLDKEGGKSLDAFLEQKTVPDKKISQFSSHTFLQCMSRCANKYLKERI